MGDNNEFVRAYHLNVVFTFFLKYFCLCFKLFVPCSFTLYSHKNAVTHINEFTSS